MGQYGEAIGIWRRLVEEEGRRELANDLAQALYDLAFAHDKKGERGLAQTAAGEALAIWRKLVVLEGRAHLQEYLRDAEALVARLSRRGDWWWRLVPSFFRMGQ